MTLYDAIDKKGVFILKGMGRIQSLISGEKRSQRPISVLKKLNSKKVTTYFYMFVKMNTVFPLKRPQHFFNFEALKCGAYYTAALS